MNIAQVTAAPIEIRMLDGISYRMSPLTQRDIGEIDLWLRSQVIERALADLPADATDEQREAAEKEATERAEKLTWIDGEGSELMSTVSGWARIVYQGVLHNHPNVAFAGVLLGLSRGDTLSRVQKDWARLNNVKLIPMKGGSGESGPSKIPELTEVFLSLSDRFGWTIEEISNMTLEQVSMYMESCATAGNTLRFKTQAEYEAWRLAKL
jgi:hypothetical protein